MERNHKSILLNTDCEQLYYPDKFDFNSEEKRALKLFKEIDINQTSFSLENNPDGFQDGSLFTYINIDDERSLLISSFGSLTTIVGVDENIIDKPLLKILESNNYIFIPKDILDTKYDGEKVQIGDVTWFYRFFCDFYRWD